jgi:head-tail adaptor
MSPINLAVGGVGSSSRQAGALQHEIALEGPTGPPAPDGDGGYVTTYAPLDPPIVWAAIQSTRARLAGIEQLIADTAQSLATHVVTMDYHPGVTTKTRAHFGARIFQVIDVVTPDELGFTTVALCTELVA